MPDDVMSHLVMRRKYFYVGSVAVLFTLRRLVHEATVTKDVAMFCFLNVSHVVLYIYIYVKQKGLPPLAVA